jgi:hypothetical protein
MVRQPCRHFASLNLRKINCVPVKVFSIAADKHPVDRYGRVTRRSDAMALKRRSDSRKDANLNFVPQSRQRLVAQKYSPSTPTKILSHRTKVVVSHREPTSVL